MKKIHKYLGFFALALIISGCETDDSEAIESAGSADFQIETNFHTTGAILATPLDADNIATTDVTVEETLLNMVIEQSAGPAASFEKIQILKSFKKSTDDEYGVESVVAETTSLPYTLNLTTLAEFTQGTEAVVEDLRIGDKFLFRVRLFKSSGEVFDFYSGNDVVVAINCGSFIEGAYTTTASPTANITLTGLGGVGIYEHSALPGLSAGGAPIPFEMADVCSTIEINTIVLGFYLVQGEGVVNPDGSFVINGYILYNGGTVDAGALFDNSAEVYTYTPN